MASDVNKAFSMQNEILKRMVLVFVSQISICFHHSSDGTLSSFKRQSGKRKQPLALRHHSTHQYN